MEFGTLTLDLDLIIQFIEFGVMINLGSYLAALVIAMLRVMSMNETQYDNLNHFVTTRNQIITSKNSFSKRLTYTLSTIVIPGYALGMNLLYIFYTLFYSGSQGIIAGRIAADNFSPITMVEYIIYDIDDDK